MKALVLVAVLSSAGAFAHRLDEYLQATTLSLEKDRVQAEIRLTPGVKVLPFVLAGIDTDGDGVLSASEQRAYAERVLHDLSLSVDGGRLGLRLVSAKFPGMQELKDGLGEIQLEFAADLPRRRSNRTLVFENHHQGPIAAYLVNCLVPGDPDIRVTAQKRSYQQSFYQLDYVQAGSGMKGIGGGGWFTIVVILLLGARLVLLWRPVPRADIIDPA